MSSLSLLFIFAGCALAVERHPIASSADHDGRHDRQHHHHHPHRHDGEHHSYAVNPSAKFVQVDGHLPDASQAPKPITRREDPASPPRSSSRPSVASIGALAPGELLQRDNDDGDPTAAQAYAGWVAPPTTDASDDYKKGYKAGAKNATAAIKTTYRNKRKAAGATTGAFSNQSAHSADRTKPNNLDGAEKELEKIDKVVEGAEAEAGIPDTTQTKPPKDNRKEDEEEEQEEGALMFCAIGLIVLCCLWSIAWGVFYTRFVKGQKEPEPLLDDVATDQALAEDAVVEEVVEETPAYTP